MSSRTLRLWLWLHKWSSLVSTAFLLMLCLTGLPLIFSHEIEDWAGAPRPVATAIAGDPPPLETLVETALASRPAGHVVPFIYFPPDEPDVLAVTTAQTPAALPSGEWPGLHTLLLDRRTGQPINQPQADETGFMTIMLRLHSDMYAGFPGMLFLGFMGLLMLMAIISGAVVYGPFMRKLAFGTVREGKLRTRWLDIHNLLGVVTLAWAFVLAGTGAINTIADPLLGVWRDTQLASMIAPYRDAPPVGRRVSLDAALRSAQVAMPDMRPVNIAFPGNDFSGPHHFALFLNGDTPLTSKLVSTVLIDAETGKVAAAQPMPWYVKALLLSQPLHFGDYGGLPMKIFWALLDMVTIVILASGLYLWSTHGRKRKRPATA